MCIICLSKAGIRQPTTEEINNMWDANPHGAGYMTIRGGHVEIHKGFMNLKDFQRSIKEEKFTQDDVVVYHFRISTQGGVNPGMTHPFPLSDDLENMKLLDCACEVGIAHNGTIRLTSNGNKEYSDTALFIADYLPALIRHPGDITDTTVKRCIKELAGSKLVLINSAGDVTVIGDFWKNKDGLMFSNKSFMPREFYRTWNLSDLYGTKNLHRAM